MAQKGIGRGLVAFSSSGEGDTTFVVHAELAAPDVANVSSTGKTCSIARTDGWGFRFRRNGRNYLLRFDLAALPETAAEAAEWERAGQNKPAKASNGRATAEEF